MKKKLSVIIVSYNAIEVLKDCIESIFKYNDIGFELEIIISDNSPKVDLYNIIKEKYRDVKIIHNMENRGFGYGNNQGVKIASGDYLLFLNPDTILIEPVFSWAIEQFNRDSKLAMFGVKLLKPDYTLNNSFMLMDLFGIKAWFLNKLCLKKDLFVANRMFTSGADIFIRKDIFQQISGFDENIFMYYEESDLVHRINKKNKELKIKYFPQKKIIHLEGGTKETGGESISSYKRQLNTFRYYCKKYDISFVKSIKSEILLYSIKKMKYKIMRQNDKYEMECEMINAANEAIRENS